MKKTNGKRNRAAGHGYERAVVKLFQEIGFKDVVTSRSGNRLRDKEKVDLVNSDELLHGRFPYNVQCKCTVKALAYPALLKQLPKVPGIINVILHKQTKRSGTRFMSAQSYAILYQEDFIKLLKQAHQPAVQLKLENYDCSN